MWAPRSTFKQLQHREQPFRSSHLGSPAPRHSIALAAFCPTGCPLSAFARPSAVCGVRREQGMRSRLSSSPHIWVGTTEGVQPRDFLSVTETHAIWASGRAPTIPATIEVTEVDIDFQECKLCRRARHRMHFVQHAHGRWCAALHTHSFTTLFIHEVERQSEEIFSHQYREQISIKKCVKMRRVPRGA